MAEVKCRHFNGYKPCDKSQNCDSSCRFRDLPEVSILVIHLGALGAVLRSTALLAAIKRKHPSSRITWVTDKPADRLLQNIPSIDRILASDLEGLLSLSALKFDIGFCIDKSAKAAGLLAHTRVERLFGFQLEPYSGAIVPANLGARELWQIGLDNELKFFKNQKTENQLVHEALELGPYERDEYQIHFSGDERHQTQSKRQLWREGDETPLIGINTGCSPQGIPYKKLSVEFQRRLIKEILAQRLGRVVLLGGPEDSQRNQEIGQGLEVIQSSTELGLRDGLTSIAACDLIISGDSLGMHMGIALKKYVVAWFGPTCAQEIDLYGRGVKLFSRAGCGPCWKRLCQHQSMCYDQVVLADFITAIKECKLAKKDSSHSDGFYRRSDTQCSTS